MEIAFDTFFYFTGVIVWFAIAVCVIAWLIESIARNEEETHL